MYELVRYILPEPSRLETKRRRDAARATRGGRRSPSSGDGAGDIGDRRRRQRVVERQRARADQPGAMAGAGAIDLQLAGGQRVGLAVDDLAQRAEQIVPRLGEVARDD